MQGAVVGVDSPAVDATADVFVVFLVHAGVPVVHAAVDLDSAIPDASLLGEKR